MKIPTKSLLLYLTLQSSSTTVAAFKINNNNVGVKSLFHSNFNSNANNYLGDSQSLLLLQKIRGGDDATATTDADTTADTATDDESKEEEIESLEDRVYAAMRKLGLSVDDDADEDAECKDGVCTIKPDDVDVDDGPQEDIQTMTSRISKEMDVDETIVFAALGATAIRPSSSEGEGDQDSRLDEHAARQMIENEIAAIQRVMEDCDEVEQLVKEGHDKTLSRRALAFADMNVEMARVILLADEEDAKADEEAYAAVQAQQQQQQEEEAKKAEEAQKAEEAKKAKAIAEKKRLEEEKKRQNEIKTVKVDANFDPTKPAGGRPQPSTSAMQPPQGSPKAAKKEDVVFQATSANIQELVLESPVPVLLDVYADWCGPCKALTPALEDMAVKAGGMFRLVKLNTDQERSLSSALEVKSLPTVFGIKDGKILHSFQGMPRSEDFMKNFMMGMFGAGQFNPKVTAEEQKKYDELSNKLVKMAGAAGYSFSQRERLQVRTNNKLDELVEVRGDMADAEETAKILRSLLSNVIRDPFDIRFRRVNLENKIIAARVGAFAPAISILKSVGFVNDKGNPQNSLILGKGKKIVSVAPFVVARDTIDKWIDSNRRAIATAARKKQDEIARAKLLEEAEEVEEESDEEEEVVEKVDPNACTLKVRLEGKNKIHDISLNADDPLSAIIESLPFKLPKGDEIQITCTARRLIVKSSNTEAMKKSLRGHRLAPAASVVVKVIKQKSDTEEGESSNSSIKERAAARRVKKKGEHTMQSIGLYSKDDNAKGELIDGGGGVWYEHDVSDDEGPAEDGDEESSKDDKSK